MQFIFTGQTLTLTVLILNLLLYLHYTCHLLYLSLHYLYLQHIYKTDVTIQLRFLNYSWPTYNALFYTYTT